MKKSTAASKAPIKKAVKASGTGKAHKAKAPPLTGPTLRRDAGGKI